MKMEVPDETVAATIIQRYFRKHLNRVKENQKLINKVNSNIQGIAQHESYGGTEGNLHVSERLISDSGVKEGSEKLRTETREVYEELQRFYKSLRSSGKHEISIIDLLGNIERKISALRGVSSLEKWQNISFEGDEDNYEDIARKRHEQYLSSFNRNWWEQLELT